MRYAETFPTIYNPLLHVAPPSYSEEQEHVLEGESLSPPLTPTKPVPRERERLPSTYIKRKRTIYTAGSLYMHYTRLVVYTCTIHTVYCIAWMQLLLMNSETM